jgi:hypothetical protein
VGGDHDQGIIAISLVAAGIAALPRPALAGPPGAASPADGERATRFRLPQGAPAMAAKERNVKWNDLAFVPGPELAAEAREAWSWLVPGRWRPILFAMVGGIFLESEDGTVHWLDIGGGTAEEVAPSVEAFEAILRSGAPVVEEWFLPALVEALRRAGKRPGPGQAYLFLIMPVFAEGKYVADNMVVVSAREQVAAAADIHRQIADLPDGTKVEMVPGGPAGGEK